MVHTYPPLDVQVRTPRPTLAGATDELLERLVPIVRVGIADAAPWPFDDPSPLYADRPDREWRWLRGIWAGRARVDESFWRLYFVVLADDEPIGTTWDTRRGEAAPIQRWRLTRDAWERIRRDDIELVGVEECLPALGLV